ncbi:MAG: hypothetical protein WD944_05995 [Steroidobacteraceae bacterium]
MTIEFEPRTLPDHVRLKCTGTFSLEAALNLYEQAFAIAAGAGRDAVLGHEPIIHRERFSEIVATNRGAAARVFTDENEALEWLLASHKSR